MRKIPDQKTLKRMMPRLGYSVDSVPWTETFQSTLQSGLKSSHQDVGVGLVPAGGRRGERPVPCKRGATAETRNQANSGLLQLTLPKLLQTDRPDVGRGK